MTSVTLPFFSLSSSNRGETEGAGLDGWFTGTLLAPLNSLCETLIRSLVLGYLKWGEAGGLVGGVEDEVEDDEDPRGDEDI